MIITNKLMKGYISILSLLNFIALTVIIWSAYHGFDLSDESFYYLGYTFYNNIPNLNPTSFHLVYYKFFSFFNFNLSEIRVLRLFLTVLSSIILFYGVKTYLNDNLKKIILFNVILSGMLLSYAWGPLALSYNSMSYVVINLIIGLWLQSFSKKKIYIISIYLVTIGFLFAVLFFVKVTNILLFPIILIASIYWLYKLELLSIKIMKNIYIYILSFLAGVFLALLFLSSKISLILPMLDSYLMNRVNVVENDPSHSLSYLFDIYWRNFIMVTKKLFYPFLTLLISFLILKISIKFNKEKTLLFDAIFKIISILVLIGIIIIERYWLSGRTSEHQTIIVYLYIGGALLLNQYFEKQKVNFLYLIGLLSVPIAGAIGTNNGLSAQVLLYGSFIFLVIFLLNDSKNFWYKSLIILFIVSLTLSQISTAIIFHPYRQVPLTECNQKLNGINSLKRLSVDREIFDLKEKVLFLDKLNAEYMFSFSRQRGIILLANKKPYSLSWFHPNLIGKTCTAINNSKIKPHNVIFLLPKVIPQSINKCFEENNIFLEKDYVIVKQIKYLDQIFRKNIILNIHIHKNTASNPD